MLLVFEVMVEEFLNVIESLTIWYSYTPEHKLLWEEPMIRLSILSFHGVHLLSRRMTVGGMDVFELSRGLLIIHRLADPFRFGTDGWSRFLSSAVNEILVFGNVINVFELSPEDLLRLGWDRDAVGFTGSCGFGVQNAAGDILACNICQLSKCPGY